MQMTLRGTPHFISHITELEQCWWHRRERDAPSGMPTRKNPGPSSLSCSHYLPHGGEKGDEETPGWEGGGGAVEVFTLSKTLVFKTVLPFLGCSLKEIIQRKGKKNL